MNENLTTEPSENTPTVALASAPPTAHRDGSSANFSINKSILVDQAYDEFCRRVDAGEKLDPNVFCARFPALRSSLARLLDAHFMVEEKTRLAPAPEIRWPNVGETFLSYRLLLELGKGAFARVFLATESKLGDRLVAIKVAYHGAREAEVLGRIQHPNIVPVHSVQEDQATELTVVCMAYVGSATLGDVLDHAFATTEAGSQAASAPKNAKVILDAVKTLPYPLDPSAQRAEPDPILKRGTFVDGVRLIGARLAEALEYIHERGISHRDLKPSNVLMSPEGVPMLLDFNLCADAKQPLFLLGGTMQYMSPEQLYGMDLEQLTDPPVLDHRSDLFSLGVILYQLATGVHPFGPVPLKVPLKELRQLLLERQQQGPRPAHEVNPDVDVALSRLLQRCLANDADTRPQKAQEIANQLRRELKPLPRTVRLVRRNPWKSGAAVLLAAVLALAGITYAATLPPYGERQLDAGRRCYQESKYEQAIEHCNNALKADPKNVEAIFTRARAHQQMGDFNLAMQGYQEADRLQPQGRIKAAMGYCLNVTQGAGGGAGGAAEYYRLAIEAQFATAEVYNNWGATLLKMSKRSEARKALNKAIELDPALQVAYYNRAYLEMLEAQSKGSELKPGKAETQAYGDLKNGIADIQKAIDLGMGSAELYRDAGRLCALGTKVEEKWAKRAVEYLEEAVKKGYDPAAMRKDALFTPLKGSKEFDNLADSPTTGAILPFTSRIVDPILDR